MTYTLEEVYRQVGLDKYCYRILILMFSKMVFKDYPMRYNQLYRLCEKSKVRFLGMTKPTFNDHIKHLVSKGYVKKKKMGKQSTVLFLTDKLPEILEAKETVEGISHMHQVISKRFSSMTIDERAKTIAELSTITGLVQQYILIQDVLNPKDRWDHVIAFSMQHAYLQSLYIDMLDSCIRDKKACATALGILGKALELKTKEVELMLDIKDY